MSSHFERGQILLSQRRFEQAEVEFRRGLADDPNHPVGHMFLAEALLGRNSYIEATEEAQRAVGLDPDFDPAYGTLARALLSRNRFDEAESAINRAIVLDPAEPDYRSIRAAVYMTLNKRSDALDEVNAALAMAPEHGPAMTLKPRILQSLGRLEEADAVLAESLRQNADDAESHVSRGWVLLEQGKAKEARAVFRDALRIDPNNGGARAGLVESIKGTNILYRAFLAYTFRMSRLQPRTATMLLIGLFVLVRLLNGAAANNPAIAPFVTPVVVLYLVFAVTTWIAVPLSNLLLRLHPDGRLALSDDQRRGSNLLLVCMAAIGISVALAFTLQDGTWLFRAVYFFLLMLPVSSIMHTPRGWPRQVNIAMCVGLGCLILIGLVSETLHNRVFDKMLPILLLLSQFVASALVQARPRDIDGD